MLSVASYSQDHVDRCRARIDADVAAFEQLAKAAGGAGEAVTAAFFNNLLLALDRWFLHRARAQEGKDGNPLNEVRVLCDSLTEEDGVVTVPKAIRWKRERTVLGLEPGAAIALDGDGFRRLAEGFFSEIEAKYR